jgi:hypothetical protein
MEEDNDTFTVSPDKLELIPSTLYKKYALGKNSKYFQHSNNLKAIEIFSQANNEQNNVLGRLPEDIQLYILEWCNLKKSFIELFKGFLNSESLRLLQNPIFHFKDYDIQVFTNKKRLKKILKNPEDILEVDTVMQTFKKNQLLADSVEVSPYKLEKLNKKNKKNLIPVRYCDAMIGFPFTIMPLFPQQHHNYHNGHLISQYLEVEYFKRQYKIFNEFQKNLSAPLNENLYIKSFYCFLVNKKDEEKIFFVELMDETLIGDSLGGQYHDLNAIACQNHCIKIYKSSMNDQNKKLIEEIDTIILPVLNQVTPENPNPQQDSKPFSNARFDILTIFKGLLILHDKKNNQYPCFAPPNNEHIIEEEEDKRIEHVIKLHGYKPPTRKEIIIETVKQHRIKIALFCAALCLLYHQRNFLYHKLQPILFSK